MTDAPPDPNVPRPQVDGYLTPTVGVATTPDPGQLPPEFTLVYRVRGPAPDIGTVASQQWNYNSYSWRVARYSDVNNNGVMQCATLGGPQATLPSTVNALGPQVTGGDELLAMAVTLDNGAGTRRATAWVHGAAGWTAVNTRNEGGALPVLDDTERVTIGAWDQSLVHRFGGRIYSVEMRAGLDPAAGAVLWRFDANEYPGGGATSYVDPRGRTWTLTAAGAITPVVPAYTPRELTPTPRSAAGCTLGCPETRVYVMDFCGRQVVCDITDNVTFLKWGRDLDDDSEVEVSLHLEGDSSGRGCCECLEKFRTWRNEVMIVRGGDVVWGPGPLVTIQIQRHIAHLVARDVLAWLDVRLVHTDYDFKQVDLGTIAKTIVEDALTMGAAAELPPQTRDACILDLATFEETGKFTDMEIKANRRAAGEVLRELAGEGLDFTVLNRTLHVGADFQFGPIGPLRDEDFAEDLIIAERGLGAANKWFVSSEKEQGSAGGPDGFFGLIERGVEGQPAATSRAELEREAADRLTGSNPPPLIITVPSEATLVAAAPVCPENLVPGTLVDLAIRELCRPATIRERLTSVKFTLDENGERAGITLAPLGELGEQEAEE